MYVREAKTSAAIPMSLHAVDQCVTLNGSLVVISSA